MSDAAEQTDDLPPAAAPPERSRLSGIATLGDGIEILVDKRLPHLDRGPSLAYAARAKNESTDSFFALVCENHLVPRSIMAPKFAAIMSPGLVRLAGSGVVYWPPAQGQRYVFVYENTLGKPLMKSLGKTGLGWKHENVMKGFIKPMINVLLDMRDADMVHGAINPMNIYEGGSDEGIDRVILGECLSTPPSYLQPAVFLPVERAQADPIARGPGTMEDDIYAFGVTLTMVLRSRDPLAGMNDEEIIRQKIELGSYAALTGKDRYTGAILELLRGLLYDDRVQRWTLDEIEAWQEGQRLSPKQSSKKSKAARPIHFNEERYHRPVLLAMDMDLNQSEAVQIIDGGILEQWISRSLEDNLTKGRYEQAIETAQEGGRGPGYWDRLLSRVSIALDPEAPLRFKGLKMHPEGIPYALAETYMLKRDLMPFIEIINQQLVMFWIAAQQEVKVDVGNLISKFDSCRAFLRQNTMGYGIERCLYFLNPECQCISERLQGYYVRNPEDLMFAFEDMSDQPKRPDLFIDRHIAAFLSVKDRRMIDPFLQELNGEEYYKKVLANVKILATIQKRSQMQPFPGIAAWIASSLEPVYERFHDRELRTVLRERIEKLKVTGDLVKMITLLDDNELRQRDFLGFKKAMEEYRALTKENEELKRKMEKPETFGRDTGQEVAAIVSGILAAVVILTFAFMHFSGGSAF